MLQAQAAHAVNLALTSRNWLMGCYIVEFEQNGEDRAAYGEQLLKKLEQRLKIKGLNERRSSTHLNTISGIENPVKRAFYEMETIRGC